MDASKVKFYKLDRWSGAFGEWPLYPDAVEEVVRDVLSCYSYSARQSDMLIVNLILDGELSYRCNGGSECVVEAAGIFVIPANSDYTFWAKASTCYHKLVLEVRGHSLAQFSDGLQLNHPLHLSSSIAGLEERIRRIGALLKGRCDEDLPEMQSLLHGILAELSLAARVVPDNEMRLLAKAKSCLETDLEGVVGIADLAAELGVSYSLLNKLFNKKLGMSPLKYRTCRKMADAKRLLKQTSLSVKEVSLRVGYASQLYFSNDFKRNCGVSPREFRRSGA